MTLNVTFTSPRWIYQCADYRLTDVRSQKSVDFQTQKILLINTFRWSATVCFTGIGHTGKLNVGDWLASKGASIQHEDPFDRLIEELLTADEWLSKCSAIDKRHSFSVGAFVGSEPRFALISNFEDLSGARVLTPRRNLSAEIERPTTPKLHLSGQVQSITEHDREQLIALIENDQRPEGVQRALSDFNQRIAARNTLVSPACFTTYLRLTGEGGGTPHGIGDTKVSTALALPKEMQDAIISVAEQQGIKSPRIQGIAIARSEATDDFHETQLREKPLDPDVHSNYGVFLLENKKDAVGAEREYRKALELNENHVNALGNLANVLWDKGQKEEANESYRRAVTIDPGNENITFNYARFLIREFSDSDGAVRELDKAIDRNPQSVRLLILRGELHCQSKHFALALTDYGRARELVRDNRTASQIATGYAIALHLSSAPVDDCIIAYRAALGLSPNSSDVRLNLAQLLFIQGELGEANYQLRESMRLGLSNDARLEALFYLLLSPDLKDPIEVLSQMSTVLKSGGRFNWNVQPNIDAISCRSPWKVPLLHLVLSYLRGERDDSVFAMIRRDWRKRASL
jgi:Tfp pilus assembly protein PilF